MSRHWSLEEDRELRRLFEAGHDKDYVAGVLHRTTWAVRDRWSWIRKSDEERRGRRDQVNAARRCINPVKQNFQVTRTHRPPDEVLADRDRRQSAPRTISAYVLGDPPVGFSALDRRAER